MSKIEVHVGESLREVGDRVLAVVERMEADEDVHERHIGFESWELMVRTLSPKRLELLRHVHAYPAKTVLALAQALDRDYKNVHADVEALESAGLLDRDREGLRADYDTFDVRMTVAL